MAAKCFTSIYGTELYMYFLCSLICQVLICTKPSVTVTTFNLEINLKHTADGSKNIYCSVKLPFRIYRVVSSQFLKRNSQGEEITCTMSYTKEDLNTEDWL